MCWGKPRPLSPRGRRKSQLAPCWHGLTNTKPSSNPGPVFSRLWNLVWFPLREEGKNPTNQAENRERVTHLLLEVGLLLLHQLTHPLRLHSFLQQLGKSKSSYLAATRQGSQQARAWLALGLEVGAGWEKHKVQSRAPALPP